MAFKFVAFAALLAAASAGVVPVAYHHEPAAHAAVSYSSHVAHAAPAYGYAAAPVVAKVAAPVAYAAAPVHASYHSYAAPAVHHTYAAPAVHHAYAAPAVHAYAAPVVTKVAAPVYAKTVVAEHHAPAHYDFEYSVHDPHTGDDKSQSETRRGDTVQGHYSVVDPDGTKRVVHYTADDHNGFNAVVEKQPGVHPVAVKAVHHAPALAYAAAPAYGHAYGHAYDGHHY